MSIVFLLFLPEIVTKDYPRATLHILKPTVNCNNKGTEKLLHFPVPTVNFC